MTAPVCPECVAGKHANCDGDAFDPGTDRIVECACPECARRDPDVAYLGVPDLGDSL